MRKSNLDEENNEAVNQNMGTTQPVQPAQPTAQPVQPQQPVADQPVQNVQTKQESIPFNNPIYDEVDPSRLQHDNHNDNKLDKFGDVDEASEERPAAKRRMNPKE